MSPLETPGIQPTLELDLEGEPFRWPEYDELVTLLTSLLHSAQPEALEAKEYLRIAGSLFEEPSYYSGYYICPGMRKPKPHIFADYDRLKRSWLMTRATPRPTPSVSVTPPVEKELEMTAQNTKLAAKIAMATLAFSLLSHLIGGVIIINPVLSIVGLIMSAVFWLMAHSRSRRLHITTREK